MTVIGHIFATAVAALTGFGWLSLLRRPGLGARTIYEVAGLSVLVGMMILAIEIHLLGRLGIPLSLGAMLALQVPPLALAAARLTVWKTPPALRLNARLATFGALRWWEWALLALIVSKIVYVYAMNLTELRRTDDAFTWALSLAKHTYYEGSHAEFVMGRNYPKFPGLMMVWSALARGTWDEFAINLTYFNLFAGFLVLFYANVRARASRGVALASTYLLSGLPLLVNHAVLVGYADLPLAIYLCFAGVYAYRLAAERQADHLALAIVFALFLPLTKLEGKVPYFLFAVYVIALGAAHWREWLSIPRAWLITGALTALGVVALTILFSAWGEEGPSFIHERLWYRIRPGNHWDEIRAPLWAHFGYYFNNWPLVGALTPPALLAAVVARRGKAEYLPGLYGLLLLASYLYLFCVGGAVEFLINGTTVNRSFMQIFPVILYAVTVSLAAAAGERDGA